MIKCKPLIAIAVAGTLGVFGAASPTAAQDYPSETISITVPWAAGGGTDAIGRAFASALKDVTDVTVVVENVSGAGGATGSFQVAQASADGYTVLLNGSSDLTAPMVFQDLPFTLDDFRYVGGFYVAPTWMVANAENDYESFDDYVEAARENPGELTLGVGGATNAHALMGHAIKGHLDLPVRIVNYQGGAALKRAVLANEIDAGVVHSPVLLSEIEEGIANVLVSGGSLEGISYEKIRDTPTLKDEGIPISVGVTRGLMVPAGTPDDVVEKLSSMTKKAANSESFAEFGQQFGFEPTWLSADEFEETVRGELETFESIESEFIGD